MPRFSILSLLAFAATANLAFADDQADRERRAKAATAVAKAMAERSPASVAGGVGVAPQPRVIVPKDYAIGRKEALLDQSPLVVYVACDGPKVDGAVTCFVPSATFGEVTGPAVVVGYPSGDRLLIEKTLPIPPPVGELKKAVENAAKKIETPPKSMPASPLDTQIRKTCICGENCKCDPEKCPGGCPAVTKPTVVAATQSAPVASSPIVVASQQDCRVEYFYGADGRLYQRTVCPNRR